MALPRRDDRPALHDASENAEGAMGFLDHLDELRSRLIRSCVAIIAGMIVAYSFVDRIALFVLGPTLNAMPPGTELQTARLAEGFAFYLDITLIAGALLASPYLLFQIWRFIAPGLRASEKRLAVPFVIMGAIGTVAGAAFSHYLLFPSVVSFFGSFNIPGVKFEPRIEDTFAQYKHMMLAMVAVFQLPTLVFFLARFRMVTAGLLLDKIKYAVFIIFIAAALLTPSPDLWNQIVMAAPMLAMYLLSIGVAWLAAPRGKRTESDTHPHLRLVVAASLLDQARRSRT
jgi:sec-independent protein translocase protein TatC